MHILFHSTEIEVISVMENILELAKSKNLTVVPCSVFSKGLSERYILTNKLLVFVREHSNTSQYKRQVKCQQIKTCLKYMTSVKKKKKLTKSQYT